MLPLLIGNCSGSTKTISLPEKKEQKNFLTCSLDEYMELCKTDNVFLYSKEECMKCSFVKEEQLIPYLEEKKKAMYEVNYSYLSEEDLIKLEKFHKDIYIRFRSFPALCVIKENRRVSVCENAEEFTAFMDARVI